MVAGRPTNRSRRAVRPDEFLVIWQGVRSVADGRLQLEWKEHDGPPVKAPTSKGFGSRLLARAAMGTDLHFDPDGLRCVFTSRI